jgi:arylsulfatase A-like enzyme
MTNDLNLLVIGFDDMNDWPLVQGHPQCRAPALRALMEQSVVFDYAQIAASACSPSRIATLYGQAPWRTGAYNNKALWGDVYQQNQQISFFGRLRAAGKTTMLAGKMEHGRIDAGNWDEANNEKSERFAATSLAVQLGKIGKTFDFGVSPDDADRFTDRKQMQWIIERMEPGDTNKVWAYGVHRPHAPWIVPKRFYRGIPDPVMDPPELAAPFNPFDDACVAGIPRDGLQLIQPNRKVPRGVFETGEYNAWVRSYLAAIQFADDCLGKVIRQLDACGLRESTIIVVFSDNGLQMGSKQSGRKFALWERVTRVPFMISGPGIVPRHVSEPVSLLDLYPTLAALLEFDPPDGHVLDGNDLTPVLCNMTNPEAPALTAFTPKNTSLVHFAVRDFWHRYIKYGDGGRELYNKETDFYEHNNIADAPDSASVIAMMEEAIPESPAAPIDGTGEDEE